MSSTPGGNTDLVRRWRGGDPQALAELFARYRDRLRRMVRLRLDRRLQGQVDDSDVLRQAYGDVSQRAKEYDAAQPVFLWLRSVTGQRLQAMHRLYLGGRMGDAGQEVLLYRGALPQVNSVSLAGQLLGRVAGAGPENRAEKQIRLQEALNSMDALDREILALRHFEDLTNDETAQVLGLETAVASNCYIRALKRLKDMLKSMHNVLP
jgi:RNA polymerase sigma-70 factor, ECF subfamily